MSYETFEHKADIGVLGRGKNPEEAFQEAAKAMFSIMCNIKRVEPKQKIRIKCEANDPETLLAEWLNTLLAEAGINSMLFSEFKCRIKNNTLNGEARGETLNQEKHQTRTEVKAATYSELRLRKQGNEWIAQCIVDV